jgi:hypothetical protein
MIKAREIGPRTRGARRQLSMNNMSTYIREARQAAGMDCLARTMLG